MKQPYMDFLIEIIEKNNTGTPIYTSVLAEMLAKEYELPGKKAAAATAVAIGRILEKDRIEDLRFYQKGIYYRTKKTIFGEIGINKEQLIADKYLNGNCGYEGGLTMLQKIGLTTQMPKERVIITNKAGEYARKDQKLGITIKPPRTKISAENKDYLRILDVLDVMKTAPVDADNPYEIIAKIIAEKKLEFKVLLALADQFYNQATVLELAHTAGIGGI